MKNSLGEVFKMYYMGFNNRLNKVEVKICKLRDLILIFFKKSKLKHIYKKINF